MGPFSQRRSGYDSTNTIPTAHKYDSRGDNNLRRVFNQISLLGLFLNGNMDKLVATPECPGLSYLNTVEREISLLNTGISSLSLSFDTETDKWLLSEIL